MEVEAEGTLGRGFVFAVAIQLVVLVLAWLAGQALWSVVAN